MEEASVEQLPQAPGLLAMLIPLAAIACLIALAALSLVLERGGIALPGMRGRNRAQRGPGSPAHLASAPDHAGPATRGTRRARILGYVGAVAWLLVFIALLAFLALWGQRGLMRVRLHQIALASGAILLAGTLSVFSRHLRRLIRHIAPPAARSVVRALLLVVVVTIAAAVGAICIELPYNEAATTVAVQSALWSAGLVALVMAAAFFLFQQHGGGPALVSAACCGIGIAQHFVQLFKGTAILPSDLFSLGTAAAVADRYTYELDLPCLSAIGLTALAIGLLSLPGDGIGAGKPLKRAVAGAAANLVVAVCLIAAIIAPLRSQKIEDVLQFDLDRWTPITSYKAKGFLPGFLALVQDLPVPKPEGYSDAAATDAVGTLAARYDEARGDTPERAAAEAQYAQQKPTVIAIMDESFADLSIYDGLRMGYTGPRFYNSLTGALQRGTLQVSIHGGGTCNTEFEFLTGDSMAFIGTGKYPYMLYDLAGIGADALPNQLKREGYATTAIHPMNPRNWNRAKVYEQFGFDRFLTDADFDPATDSVLHAGYSDEAAFDKIIDLLDENPDPQFIFEVTMQNHGGYDAIDVPEDLLAGSVPEDVADDATRTQLTEYLALVNATDRALERLIEQLRQMDRPVVLLFFGDHQPSPTRALNDALYGNEDPQTHDRCLYQATYLMWANYDLAGSPAADEQLESGASTLAAQLLDRIGAPLSGYQRAQLGASRDIAALGIDGYRGADGTWYATDAASPYADALKQWQMAQYLFFARKL